MGICLAKKKTKKTSTKSDKSKDKLPNSPPPQKKAGILRRKSSLFQSMKNNPSGREILEEESNHVLSRKLKNATTLRQKIICNNQSPEGSRRIEYTSKLSSTIDHSKRPLKNSLVEQNSTVRHLIEKKSTFRTVRKNLNFDEKIKEVESEFEDKVINDVINVKDKIALEHGFKENFDLIHSGMFTGVLSVNSEHVEGPENIDVKIQGYNMSSKPKTFVRKNCFLPQKFKKSRKELRDIKKSSVKKFNSMRRNKKYSQIISLNKDAQSEDCCLDDDQSFEYGKKKGRSKLRSKKSEGKMTLQQYVLKKNQIDFIKSRDKKPGEQAGDSKTKPKSSSINLGNIISEDDFSSSSSYLEDLSDEDDSGIKEMRFEVKSRKSKKRSLHEKTLENIKQMNQINCTIERMLQGRSSRFSDVSSFASGAKNPDSPSEFSLSSDRGLSRQKNNDSPSPTMKMLHGAGGDSGSKIGKSFELKKDKIKVLLPNFSGTKKIKLNFKSVEEDEEEEAKEEGDFEKFLKGKEIELFKN